jgi:N6-adenosine-specific RNA methylase IME4
MKPYRVIVADPPWAPKDKLPGDTRGAAHQYPVMTTTAIEAYLSTLEVQVASTAILFLWRLSSMQRDALDVARAWGFRDLSEVVWNKITKNGLPWFGMGRTVRGSHETALICVRGSASDLIQSNAVRSTFPAAVPTYQVGDLEIGRVLLDEEGNPATDSRGRVRRIKAGDYVHSAKPPEFFSKIVHPLVGMDGPNLELFARRRRPGWDAVGNQLPPK